MQLITIVFGAVILALTSAFVPSRMGVRSQASSRCLAAADEPCPGGGRRDAKGRCPGETGYTPFIREAPTDFAAYKASLKKNTEDKVETKCPGGGLPDDKGRCPGDTGYKPQLRDAPTDFAAYQAQLKAKKAAGK